MTGLSGEQQAVLTADLQSLAVLACAGSGKTRTAVHRLLEVRRRLERPRGRVALLSFSNVAVDTFRKDYAALCQARSISALGRVDIDTIDAFITANILRPHAYRVMQAPRAAFLVSGSEPFLKGFTLPPPAKGAPPISVKDIHVKVVGRQFVFYLDHFGHQQELDRTEAKALVERLGRVGGYTHELGRYWCCRALVQEKRLREVFAHRYPQILVDEAQDIGSAQQTVLTALSTAGSVITLIGDPNQGIYDYAGADGAYLRGHSAKPYALSTNYRSIPAITAVAQALSGVAGGTDRAGRPAPFGAYAVACDPDQLDLVIEQFRQAVETSGLDPAKSAVLCRASKLANTLSGDTASVGAGAVRLMAAAATARDGVGDVHRAFKLAAEALEQSLLDDAPRGLAVQLSDPARHADLRPVRRLVWKFARSPVDGLPGASLQANTEWIVRLREVVEALLAQIEAVSGLKAAPNLAMRLAAKALPAAPVSTLRPAAARALRVDTVHGAKGESLDAVLYIVTKAHLDALLAGVGTEDGRIGYVAVTRPRDLLWVGVPQKILPTYRAALTAVGLLPLPDAGTPVRA
ncbi:UvrD-helicase domain-containing protein [Caulobacter sp. FWC26]|uniref:UvrD-helicase domain-containing protein n=1 Tax=Caulobacter sp. FWC26 TaxID=69665 RepID=UPI000C147DE6|nr:ATP-dependent helicase [Caulobacter sp. FWC26]AZS19184.1 ATP-dependent helicase [Caulobacter sp. FWC26]